MSKYKRLNLDNRVSIEDGLDNGLSFSAIARLIGHSPSTIATEVKANRSLSKAKAATAKCREAKECRRTDVCPNCPTPGSVCARCSERSCKETCAVFLSQVGCKATESAPWVCNGCKKRRYGCKRPGRYIYDARAADVMSRKRRSEARMGVNMTEERFSYVMTIVRPALSRKLSPYEISKLYAGDIDVSAATLYRWVERGYGGMANIELQRKVGFKPRAQHTEKRMTRHGKKRSYEAFLQLSQDEQDGCCEMDTVIGKRSDRSCILSLYFRPAHFQLYVQLKSRTVDAVKDAFDELERACGRILFRALFSVILTDNGTEFSDPNLIEASEMAALGKRCCIFYCDPRQSQQKGRCEKAHTGLRRKVPKGMSLDAVSEDDIAGVNSDVNSTPRRSLCGMSPVEMLYTAYGTEVGVMLDHFGIAQLGADDIDMRPLDDSNKDVDEGDTELPF